MNDRSELIRLLGFLTVALGLATVVLAPAVAEGLTPWLLLPSVTFGLAIVAAGAAAISRRRSVHRLKWGFFALSVVGLIGVATYSILLEDGPLASRTEASETAPGLIP